MNSMSTLSGVEAQKGKARERVRHASTAALRDISRENVLKAKEKGRQRDNGNLRQRLAAKEAQ